MAGEVGAAGAPLAARASHVLAEGTSVEQKLNQIGCGVRSAGGDEVVEYLNFLNAELAKNPKPELAHRMKDLQAQVRDRFAEIANAGVQQIKGPRHIPTTGVDPTKPTFRMTGCGTIVPSPPPADKPATSTIIGTRAGSYSQLY